MIKKFKNFLNKSSNLKFSDNLLIIFTKTSRPSVGSFIKLLISLLFDIKFKNEIEFFSIELSELDSFASSKRAKEYLLAEVSENPLFLLNFIPLKVYDYLKKHDLINI